MIILLLTYLGALIIFAVYSSFGLYHLYQYGYEGDACRTVMIVYSIGALFVIFLTFVILLL